jgi:hypothetical protein
MFVWLVVQGSIEQAVAQVEAFRGLLEHRVIARFDAAVAAGDLGGMAECARIMAEFRQGESQLVQVTTKEVLLFSDQHCMQGGPASCLLYRPSSGQLTDATHSSKMLSSACTLACHLYCQWDSMSPCVVKGLCECD